MVACEQILPKETSAYDRVSMLYTSNSAILKECVCECQDIYAQNPLGGYQVKRHNNDTIQLTHFHDGAAQKTVIRNEKLMELFDIGFFAWIDFSYDYVEFHIDTLGNAQRMMVFLPSDDPFSMYCSTGKWLSTEKDGGIFCSVENDDNTVFFKRVEGMYFYIEQHY